MKKAILISALMAALLACVCMFGGCSGKATTRPTNTSTDTNATISSPVNNGNEGEKETLDIFAGVELVVHEISPDCYVKLQLSDSLVEKLKKLNHRITVDGGYWELIEGGFIDIITQDGEVFNNCMASHVKDGDILTLQIKDSELEGLSEAYTILETSHEYTVKAEKKYVTSPEDLTESQWQELYKIAEDFVNEKVNEAINRTGTAGNYIFSAASGLPSNFNHSFDKIEVTGFNSAYVCMPLPHVNRNYYPMYFFYDANVAYHRQELGKTYSEDTTCVLVVTILNPVVSSEDVEYSELLFDAKKDVQSGLDPEFTDEYKKIP